MEAQKLSDLIDEANGRKTIWQQFKEIRASIRNLHTSIQSLFVSATVADAVGMDHAQRLDSMKAEIMGLREEMAKIKGDNDAD